MDDEESTNNTSASIEKHPDFIKYGKVMPTMIFSRIVGYIRPLGSWSKNKKEEFAARVVYEVPKLD